MLGGEVRTEGVRAAGVALTPGFENVVLFVAGDLEVAGLRPVTGDLVHLGAGRDEVVVDVTGPTTMHLLGGESSASSW